MRRRWLGYALAVLAVALSLVAWDRLPPRVPTHWNLRGEADGYSSRAVAASLMPLIMIGLRGLLALLPTIDPRGQNYARFADTYWLLVNGVLSYLALVHVVIVANGVGYPARPDRLLIGGLGVLLILVGNYLGRVEPNWFVGIRTPWTLASDTVWRRTHRVGGGLLVAGGVATVVTVVLPASALPTLIVTLGLVVVVPVVLSYVYWRREQNAAK